MKKTVTKALIATATMTCGMTAFADNHAMDDGPSFTPVEIYPCSFVDGKGMSDLNRVIDKWNAFMDDNGDDSYSAWLLTPNFVTGNNFDVGWVGVWPDGNAMGAAGDAGLSPENQAMTGAFFEVVSCAQHALFASVAMQPIADESPDRAVLRFADCTIGDGVEPEAAMSAIGEWTKHQHDNGSESGLFVWWPAFGEDPKADYDFKLVTANPSYAAFGKDWEAYGNGGGFAKYDEIVGDKIQCDIARIYDGRLVRQASD
ncbi:MAG: hypothetical protein AAF270_03860 [Pseudomonadota bacterium]